MTAPMEWYKKSFSVRTLTTQSVFYFVVSKEERTVLSVFLWVVLVRSGVLVWVQNPYRIEWFCKALS